MDTWVPQVGRNSGVCNYTCCCFLFKFLSRLGKEVLQQHLVTLLLDHEIVSDSNFSLFVNIRVFESEQWRTLVISLKDMLFTRVELIALGSCGLHLTG